MENVHIHIKGRVQGVGFRPFVYKLAKDLHLKGWVANTIDGVHIDVSGKEKIISDFIKRLKKEKPLRSVITDFIVLDLPPQEYDGFKIRESMDSGQPDLLISPDFAMCQDCQEELNNPANKRFDYPFITCTHCGPRFSIQKSIPYDRPSTSMVGFKMCDDCRKEYHNPENRRFYSQTNSCPDCKINLSLFQNDGSRINGTDTELIDKVKEKILDGNIVAVKGIGGYLLLADATKAEVVLKLRQRKNRPAKPFAIMFPSISNARDVVEVSEEEALILESSVSPIVLCKVRNAHNTPLAIKEVAPGLDRLGVMIPYAPILSLIMKKVIGPVIATSANISESPIIFQDQEALRSLASIADFILSNDREIVVPQDDSVVKFSTLKKQKIVIRRSRGFAPAFIQKAIPEYLDVPMLATGAMMKSTFGIWHQGRCNMSQYLGDTTFLESQESYEHVLEHVLSILKCTPKLIIHDMHPAYYSTLKTKELANIHGAVTIDTQHHRAHFWAVLAENDLLDEEKPVLGVILDGTGYGINGQVWGGEFFVYKNGNMSRVNHFHYFPHILGDKMSKEPRISALATLFGNSDEFLLKEKFTDHEWSLYRRLLFKPDLYTSSAGRLFDAVASLLGLSDIVSYEGEAAIYLERLARNYCDRNELPEGYEINFERNQIIPVRELMKNIVKDIKDGVDYELIAARFHVSVVDVISKVAEFSSIKRIAFSGGVFQNDLLVDLIIEKLGRNFELFFHQELSPNDECIPYGQLIAGYAYLIRIGRVSRQLKKKMKFGVKI